ncbi:hypothetical protein HELRODRAFT_172172 [Helobdella robusta]|uniref:C-type lectin domain-containing protein n=1 Tax=Helobdella robusta TaxID=6412 RepID=T1F541_HELRO|nr:hypothetical protein HELRODRAFT_172172 [Helobdella robusta]ESO04525.1 hypothetical protein HELRODRAFT_172172 [Helobdella robusta]
MFQVILTCVMVGAIECQTSGRLYHKAYSYLAVGGLKVGVCFDEMMEDVMRLEASSSVECIAKCSSATNNNLRGINYVASVASCSCVPKLTDVWCNVTNGSKLPGCVAFFTHADCPSSFDYVVEVNKCYKMIGQLMEWDAARLTCNNLSAHSLTVDDQNEMTATIKYALFGTKDLTMCFYGYSVGYVFWTSGKQFLKESADTPFYWCPYPGVNLTMNFKSWNRGEPNAYLGSTNCLQYMIVYTNAWDDSYCYFGRCVFCEMDLVF